uniref:Uncharacterized protein n=1 Tax=Opuntia streptacantha TaxID=393608 RepID=A0A7C9CZV6_OPUST
MSNWRRMSHFEEHQNSNMKCVGSLHSPKLLTVKLADARPKQQVFERLKDGKNRLGRRHCKISTRISLLHVNWKCISNQLAAIRITRSTVHQVNLDVFQYSFVVDNFLGPNMYISQIRF